MEEAIGKVTHYFGHLAVAVMQLTGELHVGDEIHVKGHTSDFQQRIDSLEIDHQKVDQAGPGSEVAFKVKEKVRGGDQVFRLTGA
jgi:putative protease